MTHDDHQRERMRAWGAAFTATIPTECGAHVTADGMLDSFDKRFPAPSAAAPVEPAVEIANVYDSIDGRVPVIDAAELASLRQKARLWDAVGSGKVRLHNNVIGTLWWVYWGSGVSVTTTATFPTAEEAVESAIAQGALK